MPAVNKLLTIGILLVLATAGLQVRIWGRRPCSFTLCRALCRWLVWQVFGMSKESLGLAGLASVTFALASQNLLTQFISSLVLCNPESPLSIGDTIRLLGTSGKVAEVGWLTRRG